MPGLLASNVNVCTRLPDSVVNSGFIVVIYIYHKKHVFCRTKKGKYI